VLNGGLPEWPMGADCKSAGLAFSGSNPLPTTRILTALYVQAMCFERLFSCLIF
jgi:hypothetical protein